MTTAMTRRQQAINENDDKKRQKSNTADDDNGEKIQTFYDWTTQNTTKSATENSSDQFPSNMVLLKTEVGYTRNSLFPDSLLTKFTITGFATQDIHYRRTRRPRISPFDQIR